MGHHGLSPVAGSPWGAALGEPGLLYSAKQQLHSPFLQGGGLGQTSRTPGVSGHREVMRKLQMKRQKQHTHFSS